MNLLSLLALLVLLAAPQTTPAELPPGHPPMPALPPGHPPMPTTPALPPGHPPMDPAAAPSAPAPDAPPARPEDVASIEAIVAAWYDAISGPAGAERDWTRFRSLFLPEARLVTTRPGSDGAVPVALTLADYERANRVYFERGGYFEREAGRRAERFGRIAQVLSTYESRRRADDAEPYSRGKNAFQLIHDGERWWIASVAWDHERPAEGVVVE